MIGWEGASFEFYVTKRTGDNLSAQTNPNTLQLIQEVYGRGQTWRITDFWFKQNFVNDLLELKLGLLNMSQEFGGFYAFPFENLTFTSGITGNVAGYSMFTWPVSQWGTDLQWNVTKTLSLRARPFCFQQLLDFEQLFPPGRQSRRDQRSRYSVRNRLETEAAYLRKGSTGTMGVWSLGQHEQRRNHRSRQKRPSRCTGCGALSRLHVHGRLRCLWSVSGNRLLRRIRTVQRLV